MHWAQAIAEQDQDFELKAKFAALVEVLTSNEQQIVDELNAVQSAKVDIEGDYYPSVELATRPMRSSATFNSIIDGFA